MRLENASLWPTLFTCWLPSGIYVIRRVSYTVQNKKKFIAPTMFARALFRLNVLIFLVKGREPLFLPEKYFRKSLKITAFQWFIQIKEICKQRSPNNKYDPCAELFSLNFTSAEIFMTSFRFFSDTQKSKAVNRSYSNFILVDLWANTDWQYKISFCLNIWILDFLWLQFRT